MQQASCVQSAAGRRVTGGSALLSALVMTMALAGALAARDARAQAAGPAVKSIIATLASSGARKECITLSSRQRLRYWYRADGPVNFTVEYVANKETLYPVKKDKAAIGSGMFVPKVAEDYCLVWTNLASHPVNISFEFARVDN